MISPKAHVSENAKIGKGVEISPFSTIYGDVEIGDGSWIGPNVTIMDGARIGKNCRIFPGAVISAIPQDLKFAGEKTTAKIGDNTTIRECVTINRGTSDRNTTRVGDNCLLMAYVHIAHDVVVGNHCILANAVNIAGHCTIEDHVILEGLVAMQQFMRIGAHAFVAGGSLVRVNIPPYVKAAREPISYVGINGVGLKRRGFETETIHTIEDIYRIIYVHNNHFSKALSQVEGDIAACPEKDHILNFFRSAEGGIMRGLS
ncbi:MAG: acyl-ACP--UDP-N-acetylglucosamine O-acyltransferase [Bacteroidota bacterium]